MKTAPYLSRMKQATQTEVTTITFLVERNNGLWDFVDATTNTKTAEEVQAYVMATGRYKSASVHEVFPNYQSDQAIHHVK